MINKLITEDLRYKDWENIDGFLLLLTKPNILPQLVSYIKNEDTLDDITRKLPIIASNLEQLSKLLK